MAHVPVVLLLSMVMVSTVIQLRRGHQPGFGMADFVGIGLGHYTGIAEAIGVHRSTLTGELSTQLSWPVLLIAWLGIASASRLDWRYRWLIAMGLLPMLAIGFLTEFWFSRYLLFTLPPLLIAGVAGWRYLPTEALQRLATPLQWTALFVCVVLMGRQSARIILHPGSAHWSPVDRFQYFEGWGSGFGYPQVADYLLSASSAPSTIFSLDGHSAFQVLAYLPATWQARVRTITFGVDGTELRSEPERLQNLLQATPAWIVTPDSILQSNLDYQFGAAGQTRIALRLLAKFEKPGGRAVALYEATERQTALSGN